MIGETVSHYRILEKLGEGGMGVVYEAEDLMLHRAVALKILPPEVVADRTLRDRFFREARTASALNHPHIAQVYELGEHEGLIFIAMELVRGRTLRQEAHGGQIPFVRLLEWMIQVTDALARMHEKGIIHRDLKPENIMIDEDGRAKVLDFGLAKLIQESLASTETIGASSDMTRPGMLMGTPHYMSPEQVRGKPADHRSDAFSLGVMMYELATGVRPFRGEIVPEVLQAIVQHQPQPISELHEELPHEFQRIVQKSLAKHRENRYQDVKDLWVDLRRLRRELDPETATPTPTDERRGAVVRPRLSRALWAIVALLVVVGLLNGIRGLRQPRGPRDPAEKPSVAVYWFESLSEGREQDYFAAGMTEELINELWKMGGLRVSTWDDIRPLKGESLTTREVGERLRCDFVLTGTVRREADRIRVTPRLVDVAEGNQVWTARFDDVLENVFALQDSIALRIASELSVQLTNAEWQQVAELPTRSREAYDHYLKGRYFHDLATFEDNARAASEYERALRIDPDYPLATAGLADAYVQRYRERYDYDEHWLDEAKRLIEASLDLDPDLSEAHESRAEVLIEEKNLVGALEAAERASELRPDWDAPYVRLGEARTERGERSQALEMFERALALRPSVDALCGRGSILQGRGDFEGAERDYRAALELQPDHVRPYLELGDLHDGDLRSPEQAESFYRRAISVRPDHSGGYYGVINVLGTKSENLDEMEALARSFVERFPYNWEAYEVLFDVIAWWRGDYATALTVLEEAVRQNPDRVWPHLLRAFFFANEMHRDRELDKAREALDRALALRPNSPRVLQWAGDVQSYSGDQEKAIEHYRRGLAVSPGWANLSYSIARSYSLLADFESAAEEARLTVEQTPGLRWPYSYSVLWNALEQLGRSDEMLPILERAAGEFGRDEPYFLGLLGAYQRCAGHYEESRETYRRALAIREGPRLLTGRAKTQFLTGDEEGALESLERAPTYNHDPIVRILTWRGERDRVEAYLRRIREGIPQKYSGIDAWAWTAGSYYARMRRFDEALAVLAEARETGHVTWTDDLKVSEASWYRQKGDMERARALLEEVIDTASFETRIMAWPELALLEAAGGNLGRAHDLAVQVFESRVNMWETDPDAALVVRLHHAMGHREEVRTWIRQIRGPRLEGLTREWAVGHYARPLYRRAQFEVFEGSPEAEHHLERALRFLTIAVRNSVYQPAGTEAALRALTLARMGRSEEAIEEIERSLRAEPESAEAAYHAACLYALVGDRERSLDWFRRAVDRGYQEFWWARVDPDLDAIRDDPRFSRALEAGETRLRSLFE
jgi:serine/threonine protein kinase/tetratricopeptide (TPR) repeat protein